MVRFPFSDLSRSKQRPALLIAPAGYGDWLLSQITSNPFGDDQAMALNDESFEQGSLEVASYVRPAKLFTASPRLITSQVGFLKADVFNDFIYQAIQFLNEHRLPT